MSAEWALPGAAAAFRDYLTEVGRDLAAGNATEHTHRPALKALVIALDPDVRAINEPKRIECGAPDFIVTRDDLPVGYIEAKDVGRSLDEIERDEQLTRYRGSLSNLILTDYLEFRWYKDGEKQHTARIASVGHTGKLRPDPDGQHQVAAMFSAFLAQQPPIVGKPEDLARRMAALTRIVRDIVTKGLEQDRTTVSPLREQLEGFRRVLIHDLSEQQFADMYAQTIAYGLFAARVNAPADEHFTRQHAAYDLPRTNPFLRQMFGQIAGPELDDRIAWAVDDLAELLARARMDLVLEDFGKRTRQEDPVVHFYETFLAAYDPKMRESRGVYYTPEPVVSYIVRSVDHILKTEFGLPDGLADNSMIDVPVPGKPNETRRVHKVQILDPACGTGTFLAQVIETIRETVVAKHGAGMWPGYVHEHLLPRLYGFELLMAPYAIAHLKLGLRLKETGYDIEQSERLRVYLTNSLEEAHERTHGQLTLFGSWLAEEADRASEVKRELPIMVVLGNPPYSGHSANKGEWITQLLHGRDLSFGDATDDYFSYRGKPLGERQPKWLNDDYVKFMRMAQWRISRTGYGIAAFVTNHGYVDNPTFRGMRESLVSTFDSVYVADLHGSAKKAESPPGGVKDANVFDIQQGTAIGIFVRRNIPSTHKPLVRTFDLWGDRAAKYAWLAENAVSSTPWVEVTPDDSQSLFVARDNSVAAEYSAGWAITDIMPLNSIGYQSHRDTLVLDFDKDALLGRMDRFADDSIGDETLATELGLRSTRTWSLRAAREELRADKKWRQAVCLSCYRPFDQRWLLYHDAVVERRLWAVLGNLTRPNIALATMRQTKAKQWRHAFVSASPSPAVLVEVKDGASLFPLWVYASESGDRILSADTAASDVRRPNVSDRFFAALRARIGLIPEAAEPIVQPQDCLNYIYAVLHSPTYRSRYREFLRTDFPRIPITSDPELFRELCRLGSRLVRLHLMEADDLASITTYPVAGDSLVEKVRYTEPGQGSEHGRVWINATQWFDGVPPQVWAFHVGGYQVCEKWLKDRKGRRLSYDDLTQYQYVVAALAETIELMSAIDEAIEAHGSWALK